MGIAKFRTFIHRGKHLAMMLAIFPTALHAEEARSISHLSQHIAQLPIWAVVAVLTKPAFHFHSPIKPADLVLHNCTYSTNDEPRIAALRAIIERNKVKVEPDFAVRSDMTWQYPFLPRNSLYITLQDQSVVSIRFDDGDDSRAQGAVNGIFIQSPGFKNTSFSASKSLANDVRQWAATIGDGIAKSCLTEG